MSTQPVIPPPQIANPLLYIALSPNTNNPQEPDTIHWSVLIAPSSDLLPADGLLYTYTAHDDNITSPTTNSARVWKFTRTPLRLPPAPKSDSTTTTTTTTTTPIIVARLLVAEVSSLDTLDAHISACSEQDVPPVNPTGYKSVTWVKGVLEKLQKMHEKGDEDEEEGEGGSDVGSKGRRKHCLGRRMGSFESVEAEGRQFFKAVTASSSSSSSSSADGGSEHGDGDGDGDGDVRSSGVPSSVEAMGVPTRVLFDRWGPWAVGAGKQSGGVEAGGKEKEVLRKQGKMGETDQIL